LATRHASSLAEIERLLGTEPARAAELANALLAESPREALARLYLGIARRLLGEPGAAVEALDAVCRDAPDAPLPHLHLGLALRERGDPAAAVEPLRRAVALRPDFADAWLALADLQWARGEHTAADAAFNRYVAASGNVAELEAARKALDASHVAEAERLLRARLARHPSDVAAWALLADIALRLGQPDEAERWLSRCVALAPSFVPARHNLAVLLLRQDRPGEALAHVQALAHDERATPEALRLAATTHLRAGAYPEAVAILERALAGGTEPARTWVTYGNALRTVGRADEAITAYRRALVVDERFGEAWWSLANLKTWHASDADLEAMERALVDPLATEADRMHVAFALGATFEVRGCDEQAFRHYTEGNRLRARQARHDPEEVTRYVGSCRAVFTPEFFATRSGFGSPAPDPIFVIGLPRAGSTLLEQILASHPDVEGTSELPYFPALARDATSRLALPYPAAVTRLEVAHCVALGEAYLERARVHRRRGTPRFIDKLPSNFLHVGLLHLALPNARIIDMRRPPLAAGVSMFRQLFAKGHDFSSDLQHIGWYYRDYVALMEHFDAVLPGRVLRVDYEALVTDTELEVRRLLAYCGLPFDAACLEFHRNPRPVSTPSSEQVRRPISLEPLSEWRRFDPWLEPLRTALGPLADG
jgi:tetratricopeptide (TPR) repeat protein